MATSAVLIGEVTLEEGTSVWYQAVGGGMILPEDIGAVKAMGAAAVFGPDTPLQDIVGFIGVAVKP